jgi:hypothetical protein
MSSLYVPGRGMVNLSATRVDSAVSEYDERLMFAQHPENGQWVIMLKMPSDYDGPDGLSLDGTTKVIPILGFDNIPHPDDALKRLYQTDTLRWGEQILDDMNRRNEDRKKQFDAQAAEGSGEAAEAMEWFYRNEGKHPQARIFVPGKGE